MRDAHTIINRNEEAHVKYKRDSVSYDWVMPEHRTEIEDEDTLSFIHVGLLLTTVVIFVAMFVVQYKAGHQKDREVFIIYSLYWLSLILACSRAGILAGFYFLSLHNKLWTKGDRSRATAVLISWLLASFVNTFIYNEVTRKESDSTYYLVSVAIAHFGVMCVTFVYTFTKIKHEPMHYLQKKKVSE